MNSPIQSIALFGMSADPPTAGHQLILRWLSDRFDWVAAWASDNPFKSHQASLDHRLAMLQLLIAEIEPSRHNIGLHPELISPRTLISAQRARSLWGQQATLTLAIGADLVRQLPSWYQIETLLQYVKLLVVPRPQYGLAEGDLKPLRDMGARIAIADLIGPAVSSTAYREQGNRAVLTPQIEAYIHQEQQYACQNAAPN